MLKIKTKILIAIAVTVVVISLGAYFTVKENENLAKLRIAPDKNQTTTVASPAQVPVSTSTLKYSNVLFYKEGENSVSYIKINEGVSEGVKQKINKVLFDESSCFTENHTTSLVQDLRDALLRGYDNQDKDKKVPYTREDIAKMDEVTLRTNLLKYQYWEEMTTQKVKYSDENLLVVEMFYDSYCGGAYPSNGPSVYNFSLKTGELIEFRDLFKDFEKDQPKIRDIILASLKKTDGLGVDEGCETDDLDLKYPHFGLTKKGLEVYSLGYPHVSQACEPLGAVVPYTALLPYMNTRLPYLQTILYTEY